MLDGEYLFHLAVSNPVHSRVELNGPVVVLNCNFDLVPNFYRDGRIQNLDGRMFGVQRLEPQARKHPSPKEVRVRH